VPRVPAQDEILYHFSHNTIRKIVDYLNSYAASTRQSYLNDFFGRFPLAASILLHQEVLDLSEPTSIASAYIPTPRKYITLKA
jgi:hypothetical protein